MRYTLPPSYLTLLALLLSSSTSLANPIEDDFKPTESHIFERSTNLQTFTGALGGYSASPITESSDSSRPYEVDGNTFPDFDAAGSRSCSVQFNSCQEAANSGSDFSVSDCDTQQTNCEDTTEATKVQTFSAADSSDSDDSDSSSTTTAASSTTPTTTHTSTTPTPQKTTATTTAATTSAAAEEPEAETTSSTPTTATTPTTTSSSPAAAKTTTTDATSAAETTEAETTSSKSPAETTKSSTTVGAVATSDLLPSIPVGYELVCDDGSVLGEN